MLRLLLLLLLLPAVGRAESNVCQPVSHEIAAPGAYCLQADWYPVPGHEDVSIFILADDVTLDCNGYRVVGPVIAPELVEMDASIGIYVGTSARTTVRNCHIVGFHTGLSVGRATNESVRSRDILLEDNTVTASGWGIKFAGEGNNRVRNNLVTDARVKGIEAYAAPGQTTVSDNVVLRTGDTVHQQGQGGYFSAHLGGWMIVEGNVISETVAPSVPEPGYAAVSLGQPGGVGIVFRGNRVIAPANPAEKGDVTAAVNNMFANGTCEENLFIGYGTNPYVNCPVPTNEHR